MDRHRLKSMLSDFLDSGEGKTLITRLGMEKKYLHLANGESAMGFTPVYYLDGNGLKCSTESSALSSAFTGQKQDVRIRDADIDQAVWAIVESKDWCCAEAFMYWLEKCKVEEDGIPIPVDEAA